MGLRGPAPTPTALRAARGGPNRNTGMHEPEPVSGEPDCPVPLSEPAMAYWRAIVAVVGAGVLARDNGVALAMLADAMHRWDVVRRWRDANPDTYSVKDQAGNVRYLRHPNVITYEKLYQMINRQCQEFGITPASRTRIHALANSTSKSKPKPEQPAAPVMRIAQ